MIKAEAYRLGFSACGFAPAGFVGDEDADYLNKWLSAGMHAGMRYMAGYCDKRCDPRLLMEETRSIVSLALNYYPTRLLDDEQYQFAWYAYGKDYHEVMKSRLGKLLDYIGSQVPVVGRSFCDTAPVLERYWAWRAGLGWIGKHTQLIIPYAGSCFFLGELLLDIELEYDTPQKKRCGNCKRCMNACPTGALESPGVLNARKCLSYLTIENRGEISETEASMMGKRIYGCDECQKACPWNRFSVSTQVEEFRPSEVFLHTTSGQWQSLTIEEYRNIFKGSAVKRATYDGLVRNIRLVKS